jgi:hypothetical protein
VDRAALRHDHRGDHRLPAPPPGLAGGSNTLFSDDATALIHQTSRGYPRAVNNSAPQALIAAFAADKTIVDESAVCTAAAEVTAE